jgi:hypothetical protein
LGKNNLDDEVYFVIGGREGREDDLEDINSRTKNIETAYPNMKVKVITTPDRGMSGTNARKAAKETEEELSKYLPKVLPPEEKLEIFNIMRPVVKETLNEGRYDQEILMQSRYIVNQFKNSFGKEYEDSVEGTFPDLFDSKGEPFYYDLDYRFIPSDIDVLGPLPYIIEANGGKDGIEICIQYDPSSFPEAFNELIAEIKDSLRHELEHVSQFNLNKGFDMKNINQDDLPFAEYLTLDYEIPAFVQGLYKRAKTKKIPLSKAINDFFDDYSGELSDDEEKYVRKEWGKWIKANLNVIKENIKKDVIPLNENATYSQTIDVKEKIAALTDHMIEKGYNIEPLPTVEFIDGDSENASNFLGKTAYYDPDSKTIALYTEGRHPKDITRSYAHELIHHIQNLEGRLGDIKTTNTLEDDNLDKLEQEANLKGTMTFRNWTDSINEEIDIEKVPEKSIGFKTYGDLKLALKNINKDQNLKKFKDVGGKVFSAVIGLLPGVGTVTDAYGVFKAAFNKPDNIKTNTWLDKLDVDDDASKIVDDTVENDFLKVAADKFMNEPDDKILDPNFNMDAELNNHLKGKFNARHVGGVSESKDYFGLNKAIKEIMEEPKYKIFSDMDGVLTDFDEAFKKVSNGIPPREYEKKFGKDKFWELIDGGGVDYWVEMPYMSDGKQYWDYIKDYDTELLSSPSRSSTSRLGKRQWVKNNMSGVKLTLAQAYLKRNYAAPNHILIDDRKSNIEEWRANGGIGILHTSAADTISQLKKLGI